VIVDLFAGLFFEAIGLQIGQLLGGDARMSVGRVVNEENGQHDPNDPKQAYYMERRPTKVDVVIRLVSKWTAKNSN
jgi:hypothetical protein